MHNRGSGLFLFTFLELENSYWDFVPSFKTKQPHLRETKHGNREAKCLVEVSQANLGWQWMLLCNLTLVVADTCHNSTLKRVSL